MNIPYVMKRCTKCGEWLVANKINFHKEKNGKWGLKGECKECRKKYREENKERDNEYCRQWHKNNKEKRKEYDKEKYEKNRDKILKRSKQWSENNKERRRETNKKWRTEHEEHLKNYHKKYNEDNPHIKFNQQNRRRSKEINQGNGITKEQWFEMMEFFQWTCAYSGEYIGGDNKDKKRTIDHIVALDNGGENDIWNCVPMVKSYNSSKINNNMLEWYLKQEYFDIDRLTKMYEWRIYAYWKWKDEI